jgi:hypothetical protein
MVLGHRIALVCVGRLDHGEWQVEFLTPLSAVLVLDSTGRLPESITADEKRSTGSLINSTIKRIFT